MFNRSLYISDRKKKYFDSIMISYNIDWLLKTNLELLFFMSQQNVLNFNKNEFHFPRMLFCCHFFCSNAFGENIFFC